MLTLPRRVPRSLVLVFVSMLACFRNSSRQQSPGRRRFQRSSVLGRNLAATAPTVIFYFELQDRNRKDHMLWFTLLLPLIGRQFCGSICGLSWLTFATSNVLFGVPCINQDNAEWISYVSTGCGHRLLLILSTQYWRQLSKMVNTWSWL